MASGNHGFAPTVEENQGDTVIAAARSAGLKDSLRLTPPADGGGWVVVEKNRSIPVHFDRAVVDATLNRIRRSPKVAGRAIR